MALLLLALFLAVHCAASAPGPPVTFSAGFTSSAVLQMAPSRAALYGFVQPSSAAQLPTVQLTLTPAGGAPLSFPALVAAGLAGSGSACDSSCWAAGFLSSAGDISPCARPSCSMGCIFAARSQSQAECAAHCSAASGKCSYTVNSSAGLGPWAMDMCEGGLEAGCPADQECAAGCSSAFSGPAPVAWKVLLPPQPRGGSFSVAVACTAGCASSQPSTLQQVTFGMVFYAFGQSNMALFANNTYDFVAFRQQVEAGQYSNLRLFQYGSMGYKTEADAPAWVSSALAFPAWPWLTVQGALNYSAGGGRAQLSSFPATALYFARSLTDLLGGASAAPPIGIIATAVGGTSIEAWTDAETLAECSDTQSGNSAAPPVSLFNGLTAPFVNTSIAGWIYLQGENNCGGVMGSSATGSGYGCQMPKLVASYRRWFSAEPSTTAPLASFGICTLASSTSEGNGKNVAHMRWSQTGNYGVLPNAIMPATYVAQLFDLGDPWEQYSADQRNCSRPSSSGQYGPGCAPWSTELWDPSLLPLAPAVRADVAPSFMGCIHPRIKSPVGRRLAHALFHSQLGGSSAFTGPTVASCALGSSSQLTVQYNSTLLRGEAVAVGAFNSNMSEWGVKDSSSFMVCYGSRAPAGSDCLLTPAMWLPAAAAAGQSAGSVLLSLPLGAGEAPLALRYGWPLTDEGDTCCPDKASTSGLSACMPGACPVKSGSSWLPGNPFYANLTAGGKCVCLEPQVCS
jgi:hypothetical protein